MKREKILIISFIFPPSSGIGGRRWAKIAKHWLKKGNDVRVLTALSMDKKISPWNNDILELVKEERVSYVNSDYPDILNKVPLTIAQKLLYRFALFFVKLRTEGNYFDKSIFWGKNILPVIETNINNGYKNIVATGAPFNYLKVLISLKEKYPEIKVWIDLRDPWTWGSGFGINQISSGRVQNEKVNELEILGNADLITVPINTMKEHLCEVFPNKNIKLLSHFFDPEELKGLYKKKKEKELVFIYAGSIYKDTEDQIVQIANSLYKLKTNGTSIVWKFYVNEVEFLNRLFNLEKSKEIIQISPQISSSEVQNEIYNADYFIAIYPERFKDHVSTKFPEIRAIGTPVIYFGNKGAISDFIDEQQMGMMLNSAADLTLEKIGNRNKFIFDPSSVEEFSLPFIARDSFSNFFNSQ